MRKSLREIYAERFEEILELDPDFEFPNQIVVGDQTYSIDDLFVEEPDL